MARDLSRYRSRRVKSSFIMALCWSASLVGIGVLIIILGTLLVKGASGLSSVILVQDTPPPGAAGGLRNAIVGSLIMTSLGVVIGTPIGILAGTYMAEYGRYTRLTVIVRFINDILLSAPSIVIGLFVYTLMVRPAAISRPLQAPSPWPFWSSRSLCEQPRTCFSLFRTSCAKPHSLSGCLVRTLSVMSHTRPRELA